MLASLLKPETVKLHGKAADWEEAVRLGGGLLVEGGCAGRSYVEAMVGAIRDYGPYVVIAPGIAIPHAKTEEGVKRDGIAILSLDNPVAFGNKDNDPVKYLFCLASTNPSNHLLLMQNFVGILEKKEFFELLDGTTRPGDVISYVLAFENDGR